MEKEKVMQDVKNLLTDNGFSTDDFVKHFAKENKTAEKVFPFEVLYEGLVRSWVPLKGQKPLGVIYENHLITLYYSPEPMRWNEAMEYCKSIKFGDHSCSAGTRVFWENLYKSKKIYLIDELLTYLGGDNIDISVRFWTETDCPYPEFFSERISKILPFIDMTKYDLLLPEKMLRPIGTEEQVAEQTSASDNVTAETVSPHDTAVQSRPAELSRAHLIKLGLVMLNRMFPDAGWLRLQDMPDLFPYFQPLYRFEEGFNLLANDNPLQVMIVLLRILEDLFQGCRNIKFDVESNPIMQNAKDNLSDVLNSWSVYREELFDKRYAIKLKEYVNAVYSQKDFAKGQFGKKLMSDILWQTKYYFLPYFDFTQILLEKPANDSPYRALCLRTSFVREILTDIIEQSMKVADVHGLVAGVPDIWEPYRFGIPNVASRRLDVLLGAKRKSANANNMSLLKYTLGIVSVLDWWLNDKMSPAYQCAGKIPYRVSPDDGDPLFSVPVRNDQNKVFAHSIRAAAEKKKAEESKLEADKAAGTQSQSEQQKKQEQ